MNIIFNDQDFLNGQPQSLSPTSTLQLSPNSPPVNGPPENGMPPVIGITMDISEEHLKNLTNRSLESRGEAFVFMTVLVGYLFSVIYTLIQYSVRTAPGRRGFEHRSITLLIAQTVFNLFTSIMIFSYAAFDTTSGAIVLLGTYVGAIGWGVVLILRSLQMYIAVKLNDACLGCYLVIKAGASSSRTNMDSFILENGNGYSEGFLDHRRTATYYQSNLKSVINRRKWFKNRNLLIALSVFAVIMTVAIILLITRSSKEKVINLNYSKVFKMSYTIAFASIFGVIIFIVFPFLIFLIHKSKEAQFLVLELAVSSISGIPMFIFFGVWNLTPKDLSNHFPAWIFLFIFMVISHITAVIYPNHKLQKYLVAVTKDDFDDPDTRRTTRSMSKSSNSRFNTTTSDKRLEFLTLLDNPTTYRNLKQCANDHLCSSLILFLDEYQALKRRVLEEFERDVDLKAAYENVSTPKSYILNSSRSESNHSSGKSHKSNDSFVSFRSTQRKSNGFYNNSFINEEDMNDRASSDYESAKKQHHPRATDRLVANTPVSLTICGVLEYLFPNAEIYSTTQVPPALYQLFRRNYTAKKKFWSCCTLVFSLDTYPEAKKLRQHIQIAFLELPAVLFIN
ncbi:hypothetical protein BB559_005740 [Furculomyces boomerangus]|uniref:RGS domain-containing protein n=1 Tax=Furculomyces boomerangus TaxID=61424 RepID=A0A2T9Y6X2_9FUNG|nr:hypothetical protein BB559_005740 [Furculomyces boomerangus]